MECVCVSGVYVYLCASADHICDQNTIREIAIQQIFIEHPLCKLDMAGGQRKILGMGMKGISKTSWWSLS